MKSFASNVARDLVDKRLWPVAAALLLALIAVPVLLGRGGSEPAPTRALTADANSASAGERTTVSLDTTESAARRRDGRLKNPFHAPGGSSPSATTASTTSSGAATASTGGAVISVPSSTGGSTSVHIPSPSAPKGPDASSGGGSGSSPSVTPPSSGSGSTSGGGSTHNDGGSTGGTAKPKPAPKPTPAGDAYQVTMRFGRPGHMRTLRDVRRLAPLPSVVNPFFVFLGVMKDHETAVFLVSSDAVATGDGTCRPSRKNCATVEMKAGDIEFFDFTDASGNVTQFELDLKRVERTPLRTVAAVRAAYARHSVAGQELLREAHELGQAGAARAYRYLPDEGVLVRARRAQPSARAALITPAEEAAATAGDPEAAARAAARLVPLVPAGEQPGVAVWAWPKHDA
jgi:hypothetical protein